MAFTVTQLITDSYYLSGVVSQDLEVVSGAQITEGLSLLNAALSVKTANTRLIPYYTEFTLNGVVAQEVYFIPNCVWIESFTFFINTVRFSVYETSRRKYNASPRVENINSLPFSWKQDRVLGGTNLSVYFTPDQNFPFVVWGKFGLMNVTLNQDLETVFDDYYIEYLRYLLTEYICEEYTISIPPATQQKLNEYESIITDISPMDLSMKKMSSLQTNSGFNWAYVNFPGWTP